MNWKPRCVARAPITVCVINNACMQFIKENQRALHGGRFISTEFSNLDFAAIARAFGCLGVRVERSGELEGALAQALASDAPAVVDVRARDDVVPERMHLQLLNERDAV